MNEIIRKYLIEEVGLNDKRTELYVASFAKHPSIQTEFSKWILTRKFEKEPVEILGYTAEKLCNKTSLEVLGAYNYLIFLLEEPERAKKLLDAGLPTK